MTPLASKNGVPSPAAVRAVERRVLRLDPSLPTPQLDPVIIASGHAVLAAMLLSGDPALSREIYDRVAPLISGTDFGDRRAGLSFRAIEDLVEEGVPIDQVLVAYRVRTFHEADALFKDFGGDPLIYFNTTLRAGEIASSPDVAEVQARQVAEATARYKVIEASQRIAQSRDTVRPEQFWQDLRQLLDEHTQDAQAKPPVDELLPLVRLGDVPEPGPTKWLVQGLWTEGAFGIVGAEPKSWKSWLTLYMGICIALGRKVFDRFEVKQGKVLVFSAEGGKGLARRRAGALCRAMDVDLGDVDIEIIDVRSLRLDDPKVVVKLNRTVERVRPVLVILDPLRKLHTADENDASAIEELFAPLFEIQDAYGVAIMLVHHMGKGPTDGRNARRQGQRLRGSSAIHGATDSALYLSARGEGTEKRVTVQPEHRAEVEPEPIVLKLCDRESSEGRMTWLDLVDEKEVSEDKEIKEVEANVGKREHKRKAILNVIRASTLPGRTPYRSATAIRDVVHGNATMVKSIVKELLESRTIVQDIKGQFFLNSEEPS